MNEQYNAQEIEKIAQFYWTEHQSFSVQENIHKEKYYCLAMFPYPSGNLHMGHIRNYTLADVVTRYNRMLGKNVLQPIGWDAFGLPAENAAISHQVAPALWTEQNIAQMKAEFKRLGYAYDWRRELATCNPDYYRWEQWLFLKLYQKGLVYKKNAKVNWDPVDQTVLANEQVIDGRGWRSGALIEQKEIPLWFLKITAYADELLKGLDELTEWPQEVRTMQRNWIGRSEGIEIYFNVLNHPQIQRLKIYTTRVDTLMGATYIAIAPEHPLAQSLKKANPQIAEFIESCKFMRVSEVDVETIEKKGIDTGYQAKHPLTQEPLPIWIANFVLMEYGSGAIMAVPGHDERDFEFAQLYKLPIKEVVVPFEGKSDITKKPFTQYGKLVHSGEYTGLSSDEALNAISHVLETSKQGKRVIHYRLRDWGISRQRYWGTPIPIIYCDHCGTVPVPEKDLPVILPTNITFTGAQSPLSQITNFYHVLCPRCGADAHRETDTFDTFIESSWYYARFACHNQNNAMLDDRASYWTPVDYYIGGIEHAVLHLLYARFFHKLMRDEGLLNSNEPFIKLLTLGMVLNQGAKMSKSKGNVVSPGALLDQYGADTVRLFIIFASPPEQSLEWSDSGVEGAHRFLKKLWQLGHNNSNILMINEAYLNNIKMVVHWESATAEQKESRKLIHSILQQALYDYSRSQFNTVVSGCMKLFNIIYKLNKNQPDIIDKHILHDGYTILLRLLAPITPHITHVLWSELGHTKPIIDAPWPKVAKDALKSQLIQYIIQVNGKLRGHLEVSSDETIEKIESLAKQHESVARYTHSMLYDKAIILPERKLINLVYKQ